MLHLESPPSTLKQPLVAGMAARTPSVRVQRLISNTLRTPFDNTESRLAGRERDVVRLYPLRQTLQRERAHLFRCDAC